MLCRQIFAEAMQCRRALADINATQKQLSDLQPKLAEHADLKASAAEAAKDLQKLLAGSDGSPNVMGLQTANSGLASALRVVESSDRAIPAQALELHQESRAAVQRIIGEWDQFKTKRLAQLNQRLQQASIALVEIPDPNRPEH